MSVFANPGWHRDSVTGTWVTDDDDDGDGKKEKRSRMFGSSRSHSHGSTSRFSSQGSSKGSAPPSPGAGSGHGSGRESDDDPLSHTFPKASNDKDNKGGVGVTATTLDVMTRLYGEATAKEKISAANNNDANDDGDGIDVGPIQISQEERETLKQCFFINTYNALMSTYCDFCITFPCNAFV
jgi:hypothetical protein